MFHKAKECYVRDEFGNRYFDLRRADNITGHSHKKLTTQIKNAVSNLLTLDLLHLILLVLFLHFVWLCQRFLL